MYYKLVLFMVIIINKRTFGEINDENNLEVIQNDVRMVGENLQNLVFDVARQVMESDDSNTENVIEKDKPKHKRILKLNSETTETAIEENPTENQSTTEFYLRKRSRRSSNKFLNENLINENSRELVEHNFGENIMRANEEQGEHFNNNIPQKKIIPQNSQIKTCSKSQEEINLENLRIKEIGEEIKKLNELVILLRDQQKIMDLLDSGKATNDFTKRFGSHDLLKILNSMNQHDVKESKIANGFVEESTNRELEKIKNDLQDTVSALNRTKIILALEREKEAALEKELSHQKQELNFLKKQIDSILKHNSTSQDTNEIVGAPLITPRMLPLLLPKNKTEKDNSPENDQDETKRSSSRMSSRASELQRLIRMLEDEEEKKSKSDDLEIRLKELEKKLTPKNDNSRQEPANPSQIMRMLLLSRLISGQSGTSNGQNSDLAKKLTGALESSILTPQNRNDDLNELRQLEAAIQSLRPKDQTDLDLSPKQQEEAQFQAMLTKLIQQGPGGSTSSSTSNILSNVPSNNPLKNLMNSYGIGGGSSLYNNIDNNNNYNEEYGQGLNLSPQQLLALKSQIGQQYGGNQYFGGPPPYQPYDNNLAGDLGGYQPNNYLSNNKPPIYPLPYQAIPSTNKAPYRPIIPYNPYSSPNYPDVSRPYNAPSYSAPSYSNIPYQNFKVPSPPQYPPVAYNSYPPPSQYTKPPVPQSYNQNQFFRMLPQPSGDYSQPQQNGPYGPKGDGGPGYDQQGYNQQGPQAVPEQYKYQKIEDLSSQVYQLQGVINNLNRPEYVQKPEDKVNVAHLEKKISDLKAVINSMSPQPYQQQYPNDSPPQPPSYASNPQIPQPQSPPQPAQSSYTQSEPQNSQNYESKTRKRRSVENNRLDDNDIMKTIGNFYKKYIDTNESVDVNSQNAQRSSYGDLQSRINDIKKQLDLQRGSSQQINYNNPVDYTNLYSALLPNYQQTLLPNYQQNLNLPVLPKPESLETKKQDIFTSIVLKILDKIIAATPEVLKKLFGYGFDQLTNSYGDSYSDVQKLFKNLGFLGYFPLIIVKLVEGFSTFLNLLKKNYTVRNFLVPVLILGLVAGSIIFLIWWLLPDYYQKDNYQIGYDDKSYNNNYNYGNNYNERNIYNERQTDHRFSNRNSNYLNRNNNFLPYSRSYFENGGNNNYWNLNNALR